MHVFLKRIHKSILLYIVVHEGTSQDVLLMKLKTNQPRKNKKQVIYTIRNTKQLIYTIGSQKVINQKTGGLVTYTHQNNFSSHINIT